MPNWEMQLIRKAFADALVELGEEREEVVVLDADLSQSTLTKFFAEKYPDRFYDMGIAEAGMVGTAAGMALMGYRPFVTSYAMFVAGRAWEFVRQQLSYGEAGVVVVGAHGGITVGQDGPTHQCNEDIALMRVLPGMNVIVPADCHEGYKAIKYAGHSNDLIYFRMGREKFPVVTRKDDPWQLGKAGLMAEGEDATFIACGYGVSIALDAADRLAKEGIKARVLNMSTIKPLDKDAVIAAADETGAIVTIEEHSIIGGLGSAVAETVVQSGKACPMRIMGLEDRYLESGPPLELLAKAGLTPDRAASKMKAALQEK